MERVDDIIWMEKALALAKLAASYDEVPVGAIVVYQGEMIGRGFNQSIKRNDPTAHAEMIALREAAEKLGNYRLLETTLYVTLEPCIMCAGALIHSRIRQLVYGAYDIKAGAVVSQAQVLDQPFINHRVSHKGGLLRKECADILSQFFKSKR